MASGTNAADERQKGKATEEGGLFTPEPSVEPEQMKDVRADAQSDSNGSESTSDTSASSSAQLESGSNQTAISASSNDHNNDQHNAQNNGRSEGGDTEGRGGESTGNEGAAGGDAVAAAPSTAGPSGSENPTAKMAPDGGPVADNSDGALGAADAQAREIVRIMAANPGFPYTVLGLSGPQDDDKVEKTHENLVLFLRPDNCKHEKASEAVERVNNAAHMLSISKNTGTGEEFLNPNGEAMDLDTASTPADENSGDSLFMPESKQLAQNTEQSDGAGPDTVEEWPWTTGLTAKGERIMAYRPHGRGYRCAVETEKGNKVFSLQSGMSCGGAELSRYLKQQGIKQFAPPETRRKWIFKHRDDFQEIQYMSASEYGTHNPNSKTGRRKDPEAWCFARWTWGFEEITVSDLRKVIGAASADAAIRAFCNNNKRTPPMDRSPQNVLMKATGEAPGTATKQTPHNVNRAGTPPETTPEDDGASGGPNVWAALQRMEEKLESLDKKLKAAEELEKKIKVEELERKTKVEELEKHTTTLATLVMKIAEKVGVSAGT